MIQIENVSFNYTNKDKTLKNINLEIKSGECVLLCGESGCGKTTITKLINGLIPHFAEYYKLEGKVTVNKNEVSHTKMYKLAKSIGSVFQNPKSQFFNLDTDSELAFGLENEGIEASQIKNQLKNTVEELKIQKLLHRNIFSLSGGEKQLLAFASVYAMNPKILVLDEPSANLDVHTIEILKNQLKNAKKNGHTIIISEHRLYFLLDLIDKVIYLKEGQVHNVYNCDDFKKISEIQRINLGLRSLRQVQIEVPFIKKNMIDSYDFKVENLSYKYKKEEILNKVNFYAKYGDVVAIVGHNGAGKTTLCRNICGLLKKSNGDIYLEGKKLSRKNLQKLCAFVMQDVNHQLFSDSVIDECKLSCNNCSEEKIEKFLKVFDLFNWKDSHPMALSGGQKQRLAIVTSILSNKKILVFDEPTSGLDYRHMIEVSKLIKDISKEKHIILIVTHDTEFINMTCNYCFKLK